MNLRLHHVAFSVRDIEESIAWYKSTFDAEVIERYSRHDMEIAHLKIVGARLELFSSPAGMEALPEYRKNLTSDLAVIGTKHVCLETDDLDVLEKTLKEKGVELVTKINTAGFGGRYVFIKDPNGILIELYQA